MRRLQHRDAVGGFRFAVVDGGGMPSLALPPRWLANDVAYRELPQGGVFGCGFQVKPDLGWDFRDRLVKEYSAVIVLRGSGTYVDERGRSWPLAPGSLLQRFTTRRHSHHITEDGAWAECWIVLPPALEQALVVTGALDPERPVLTTGLHREVIAQVERHRDRLRTAPPRTLLRHAWALADLLLALVDSADAAGRAGPHAVAMAAVCARLAREPGLALADLARSTGLSPERFRRVFQQETGHTLARFRLQCRLDLARQRLTDPAIPLKAIAEELGYASPAAFSAAFRRETGEAPSQRRATG